MITDCQTTEIICYMLAGAFAVSFYLLNGANSKIETLNYKINELELIDDMNDAMVSYRDFIRDINLVNTRWMQREYDKLEKINSRLVKENASISNNVNKLSEYKKEADMRSIKLRDELYSLTNENNKLSLNIKGLNRVVEANTILLELKTKEIDNAKKDFNKAKLDLLKSHKEQIERINEQIKAK